MPFRLKAEATKFSAEATKFSAGATKFSAGATKFFLVASAFRRKIFRAPQPRSDRRPHGIN